MSWRDLLRALDQEAGREVDEVRAEAARDAERTLAEARAGAAAEREAALARARAAAEATRRKALADAQRERARALLDVRRQVLEGVRAEALERLRRQDGHALERLVLAVAADLDDGPTTWTADADQLDAVRVYLARADPRLLERAELRAAAEPRGGVVVVAGRRALDVTAAARVERVWPDAEPVVAKALFEGGP